MAHLGHCDPGRVQAAGLDNGSLNRPSNQSVAADEGPDGSDLRMHQRCHHDRGRTLRAQQELHDPRKPRSHNVFVGCRAKIRKLSRDLPCPPGASHLRLRQQMTRGCEMDPCQCLGRCSDDHRQDVLGLHRGLNRALEHGLDRVRVLGPDHGATHEVAHDGHVHLGAVEGGARPGTPDPRLRSGSGYSPPERLMPPELGAGLSRSVGGLGHAGQRRQPDEGISNGGHTSQPRVRHVPRATDLTTSVIVIAAAIALMTLAWANARAQATVIKAMAVAMTITNVVRSVARGTWRTLGCEVCPPLLIPSSGCLRCPACPRPPTLRDRPAPSSGGIRRSGGEYPLPLRSRGSGVPGRAPPSTAPRWTWPSCATSCVAPWSGPRTRTRSRPCSRARFRPRWRPSTSWRWSSLHRPRHWHGSISQPRVICCRRRRWDAPGGQGRSRESFRILALHPTKTL